MNSNSKRFNSVNYDQKLDRFIENAQRLEQLKICRIMLLDKFYIYNGYSSNGTMVIKENNNIIAINKKYTDGIIEYSPHESYYSYKGKNKTEYKEYDETIHEGPTIISSPTWIIEAENHEDGRQFRYNKLFTWDFNSEYLPSTEELSSYEEPRSLRLYKENPRNKQ